jgi:N-acylneuraminate cytidylyltransferase
MTEWGMTTLTAPHYDLPFELKAPVVLCIIPARGGSKGFPRKNLAMLRGKPLVAHTIEHALDARCVTDLFVSTDDDDIAAVSEEYGAQVVMRPKAFAGDYAPSEWALLHVMEETGIDPSFVMMLQCTSPIRKSIHIDRAFNHLLETGADSLFSGVSAPRFIWEGVHGDMRPINYNYRARPMRQVGTCGYAENGSIYITKVHVLRNTGNRLGGKIAMYEMPYWSQFEIDEPDDLDLCEWILEREP